MGYTGDQDISNVSSISDFVAQWLDKKFLQGGVKTMMLPFEENKDGQNEKVVESKSTKLDEADVEQSQLEGLGLVEEDFDTKTKELGFTGDLCGECGSTMMVQNGKCLKCVNCGATTGCS
jgi:ribonucleoside-diphosphate reductase alpha chain